MDKPTVNLEELKALLMAEGKPKSRERADADELQERAVAALASLRGLSYADKQLVIRRMARMIRR